MRKNAILFLTAAALLATACASKQVQVPPRIELARHGTLGMVAFSSNGSRELSALATRQFMAVVQAAQPRVPILELGERSRVLAALGHQDLDPEAIRALGEKYGVDAVLVGELTTRSPKPRFSVNSLVESMRASADIEGVLSARLLQTRNGATIWTNAARGKQSVAHVNLVQGSPPRIGATDPNGAESRLVRSLVATLSADFRPSWRDE
jgi:hypothetical protein